ncbi:poly [ADP-ribose] polymerase [Pycnococcus provasolii]
MGLTELHSLIDFHKWTEVRARLNTPVGKEEAGKPNEDGQLPLHVAAMKQAPFEVDALLLEAYPEGAKQPDVDGHLPLHFAAMYKAPSEVVQMILNAYPEGIRVKNGFAKLPIYCARYNGASAEVIALLEDPSAASTANHQTATTATPPPPTTRPTMNFTKLHNLIINKKWKEVCDHLETPEAKEEAGKPGEEGDLPLHLAIRFEAPSDVIAALLKVYPEGVRQTNEFGDLPLHSAAIFEAPSEVVSKLLEAYPDGARKTDNGGDLPLHVAAATQAPFDSVELILNAYPEGVHVKAHGSLPIELAMSRSPFSAEVIELLENPPKANKRARTSAHGTTAAAAAAAAATDIDEARKALERETAIKELEEATKAYDVSRLRAALDAAKGAQVPEHAYAYHRAVRALEHEQLRERFERPSTDLEWNSSDVEDLGVGSFGHVYKVRCAGKIVAAKRMPSFTSREREESMRMMRREVQTLSQIRHPNVIDMYGIVTDDPERVCLLMEYAHRGDLRKVLDAKEGLTDDIIYRIIEGIVQGMRRLHSHHRPVMHKDLKSQNVLICDDWTPKIADFGLAKMSGDRSTLGTTRTRGLGGTLAYRAPELYSNAPFSAACDVYAFGIIAWELATYSVPWEGCEDLVAIMMSVCGEKQRPEFKTSEQKTSLPGFLAQRAWAHYPADRPKFDTLARELEDGNGYIAHTLSQINNQEKRKAICQQLGPDELLNSFGTVSLETLLCQHKSISLAHAIRQCVRGNLSSWLTKLMRKTDEKMVNDIMDKYNGDWRSLWENLVPEFAPQLQGAPDYKSLTVLVIVAGMGLIADGTDGQYAQLQRAGFKLVECGFDNLEQIDFDMNKSIQSVEEVIRDKNPNVIICASKGGAYMLELWKRGCTIPSVMINVHPKCDVLPKDVSVVLVHGSNDETFWRSRDNLENLVRSASRNMCLLYYSGDSGTLRDGSGKTRYGDAHNRSETMQKFETTYSLLTYDCLPRLVHAACTGNPEFEFAKSWERFLSAERCQAERNLGFTPVQHKNKFWETARSPSRLNEVAMDSNEYAWVRNIFLAKPTARPFYSSFVYESWESREIIKVERIQNNAQYDNASTHHSNVRKAIQDQDMAFTGGVHARWLFHGTPSEEALESIINNPVTGFRVTASGSTAGTLWGPYIYFARDAQYSLPYSCKANDGSYKMMLCLVELGMTCLGDADSKLLPTRRDHHRYDSAVDSLSNPEIFCATTDAQIYPAYVITFK